MKLRTVLLPLALACVAAPAAAESFFLNTVLGRTTEEGEDIDAKYREKQHEILVEVKLGYNFSAFEARERALETMARMARAKGYERFAVTKVTRCGTWQRVSTYGGSTQGLYHQCRLLGKMLGPDEQARARGDNPVTYFTVDEALARREQLARHGEDALAFLRRALRGNEGVVVGGRSGNAEFEAALARALEAATVRRVEVQAPAPAEPQIEAETVE